MLPQNDKIEETQNNINQTQNNNVKQAQHGTKEKLRMTGIEGLGTLAQDKPHLPSREVGCLILISRSILGILEAFHLQIFVVA